MFKKIMTSALALLLVANASAWNSHQTQAKANGQLEQFRKQKNVPAKFDVRVIVQLNKVIYLGGAEGLYESTDNGKTFTQNKSIPATNVYTVQEINKVIYVGAVGGLWVSRDNGQTFSRNRAFSQKSWVTTLAEANGVIYAGTYNDGLYESIDNGQTFTLNPSMIKAHIHIIVATKSTVYVGLTWDALSYDLDGLYKSFDNGKTFVQDPTVDHTAAVFDIKVAPDGVVYVGTVFGLYQSFDAGKTFVLNKDPLVYSGADQIMIQNNVVYLTNNNGFHYTTDDGKTWSKSNLDRTWATAFTFYNNVWYVGTQYKGLWESFDGGRTFVPNKSFSFDQGAVMALTVAAPTVYFWANSRLWADK